ncbi:MAG: hypothetical protein U5K75_07635 [Ahrensia sp.]|nr:hypothetical protein [Ahrensia sp.]
MTMMLRKQVAVRETQRRALARLRQDIADIEKRDVRFDAAALSYGQTEKPKMFLPLGVADLDQKLGGGLMRPALTEIYTDGARDAGALTGLMAAILSLSTATDGWSQKPVLWISAAGVSGETGALYGAGLRALGFDPTRLFLTAPKRLEDALWICEEAARTRGLGATVLDVRGHTAKLDLRETRRLHMRAQASTQPVFLLRQSALPQTSAAPQRLTVKASTSHNSEVLSGSDFAEIRPGSIGPPGFEITVDKNRNGPAGSTYILHWNAHERIFFTPPKSRTDRSDTFTQHGLAAGRGRPRYGAQNQNQNERFSTSATATAAEAAHFIA